MPLMTIPTRLQAVALALSDMEPDRQRVRYHATTWQRHIGVEDPDLVALTSAYSDSLTRNNLRELSALAPWG